MKKTYVIIISSIFLIAIAAAYYLYDQTLGQFSTTKRIIKTSLDDTHRTFKIDIDAEAEHPHGIELKMFGELEGIGIIGYGWTDTSLYMIDTISDQFNLSYRTDWYSDSCFIVYTPINATNGEIQIDCEIYASKK